MNTLLLILLIIFLIFFLVLILPLIIILILIVWILSPIINIKQIVKRKISSVFKRRKGKREEKGYIDVEYEVENE